MKNRLYPTWDVIDNFHNPLTEGENKLAHFLDDTLPEEWMIFVEPYLNGSRPDIVVFNPQFGVMIYEVKDWDLRLYHFKAGQLFVSNMKGARKDPVKQVNHYKMKIIEQLVPNIGEAVDENKNVFGLVKTCLYFHEASGDEARNFFNNQKTYPIIIGYDDLHDSNMKKILPFSNRKYMQNDWAEEIKWWLNPPFHSREQTRNIELTPKQKEYAKPQSGHFRLRGPAGSGKTLIIADRAAKLASQGFKVLVITYNITLWHYIKDMIARAPYDFDWRNISFNHFHGFCKDTLNELGVPPPPKNYFEEIVQIVKNALQIANQSGMNIEYLKFDAILIDEGQDYEWDWYNCLCNFLNNRDELLLVCDKKQNIYGRNLSWINGNMKNVKFRGRWREVKSVYRLPKKIGVATNRFSKLFGLDQSLEVEDYVQLKLTERPLKPHIVWKNIQINNWLPHIKNAYKTVKSEQLKLGEGHPSDIVILLPNNDMGIMAVKNFEKENIEINHVFEDDHKKKYHRHKKSFWSGDSRLKISTIHSFKGWEALHVILLIPEKWNLGYLDSLVYTAMTRTRENLIILNCNDRYIDYGRSLPSEWDVQ